MKEEKVLYVKLPEGVQYRKVIVAEDGMIGIHIQKSAHVSKKKKQR